MDHDQDWLSTLKAAMTARTIRCTLVGPGFALVALGVGLMLYVHQRQAIGDGGGTGGANWKISEWEDTGPIFGWGVAFLTLGAGCLGVAVPLLLERRPLDEADHELGPELLRGQDATQGSSSGQQ